MVTVCLCRLKDLYKCALFASLGFHFSKSLIAILILASLSQSSKDFHTNFPDSLVDMDTSGIPEPPAHYTKAQVRDYYLHYFKQTFSLSTTKDGSLAQTSKDAQHEVNQPMPTPKETELPMVAHTGSEDVLSRSEEHTSELQSHYSISYAVFCLKKKFF